MKKWYLFFLTIVLIACYDDEGRYGAARMLRT